MTFTVFFILLEALKHTQDAEIRREKNEGDINEIYK